MNRRNFVKQLLAIGFMSSSVNAVANNFTSTTLISERKYPVEDPFIFDSEDAVIKVVGIGGGGCNALNLLIDKGVYGAKFIAIDSDPQTLKLSKAAVHMHINETTTQTSSDADYAHIAKQIKDANMLIIVSGMGGETGKALTTLVSKISRELNILTIAIVTSAPACDESRALCAAEGIESLRKNVDSIIVVPIDELIRAHNSVMPGVLRIANTELWNAVACITEMINAPGLIGVDFADVRTVISEKGTAMVGSGVATGPDRALKATQLALASPLLKSMDIKHARGILVSTTSTNMLKLREIDQVMASIRLAGKEATIVQGAVFDKSMGDEMRVAIIATGIDSPIQARPSVPTVKPV